MKPQQKMEQRKQIIIDKKKYRRSIRLLLKLWEFFFFFFSSSLDSSVLLCSSQIRQNFFYKRDARFVERLCKNVITSHLKTQRTCDLFIRSRLYDDWCSFEVVFRLKVTNLLRAGNAIHSWHDNVLNG